MGDRIDLRVLTRVSDSYHDVSNCEFANDKLGPGKFTTDHLKVFRSSKVILDDMTNQEFMQTKDARRLIIPSFQANGLEGEIKLTKLVASGLYTVQHLGSVDISYFVHDLSVLRVKAIPRLKFMKSEDDGFYAVWSGMPTYCRYCHAEGHAAPDCPKKHSSRVCWNCRASGHIIAECAKSKNKPFKMARETPTAPQDRRDQDEVQSSQASSGIAMSSTSPQPLTLNIMKRKRSIQNESGDDSRIHSSIFC
ncbi:hypothetical protein G6F43_006481 [Rhizopus delemar]|nr:hypothetical protein G6F43_006481 [Rhizopus delemar]